MSRNAFYSSVDGTLNFHGGEESFGFKKLYITRARLDTSFTFDNVFHRSMKSLLETDGVKPPLPASFAKQVNKIRCPKSFICNEVALSELNLLVLLTIIYVVGFLVYSSFYG